MAYLAKGDSYGSETSPNVKKITYTYGNNTVVFTINYYQTIDVFNNTLTTNWKIAQIKLSNSSNSSYWKSKSLFNDSKYWESWWGYYDDLDYISVNDINWIYSTNDGQKGRYTNPSGIVSNGTESSNTVYTSAYYSISGNKCPYIILCCCFTRNDVQDPIKINGHQDNAQEPEIVYLPIALTVDFDENIDYILVDGEKINQRTSIFYEYKTMVKYEAFPKETSNSHYYNFSGWYINSAASPHTTANPYSTTSTNCITLTAKGATTDRIYKIYLMGDDGGIQNFTYNGSTFALGNYISAYFGTEYTFTYNVKEDYKFDCWVAPGIPVGTESTFTYTITESVVNDTNEIYIDGYTIPFISIKVLSEEPFFKPFINLLEGEINENKKYLLGSILNFDYIIDEEGREPGYDYTFSSWESALLGQEWNNISIPSENYEVKGKDTITLVSQKIEARRNLIFNLSPNITVTLYANNILMGTFTNSKSFSLPYKALIKYQVTPDEGYRIVEHTGFAELKPEIITEDSEVTLSAKIYSIKNLYIPKISNEIYLAKINGEYYITKIKPVIKEVTDDSAVVGKMILGKAILGKS